MQNASSRTSLTSSETEYFPGDSARAHKERTGLVSQHSDPKTCYKEVC